MRVLVVGGGAREHALVAALAGDAEVLAAPGNPGIAAVAECRPLDPGDPAAVAALARTVAADLVVVGPEGPLVAGAADAVRAAGVDCFGPSAAAARIEGSKAWAKDVMAAAGVPTAAARVFAAAEIADALAYLDKIDPPYVVKFDGLAAGKGVTVTDDLLAARRAVTVNLGHAGDRVVVEDYLDGPEVSLFAVCDGTRVLPLLAAQDFKRLGDGDRGPNTGGMGAYAPLPWLPADTVTAVTEEVLRPTVAELARRGAPFRGLLYAGLALTAAGPRVVEFNARFGDPETEAVLPLLASPLAPLLAAAARGDLGAAPPPRWHDAAAVTVVLAAAGYPASPRTGDPLGGLDAAAAVPGVSVYHAGTCWHEGDLVSNGGRVLAVTAVRPDAAEARTAAYDAVAKISLPGGQFRRDIAAAVPGAAS